MPGSPPRTFFASTQAMSAENWSMAGSPRCRRMDSRTARLPVGSPGGSSSTSSELEQAGSPWATSVSCGRFPVIQSACGPPTSPISPESGCPKGAVRRVSSRARRTSSWRSSLRPTRLATSSRRSGITSMPVLTSSGSSLPKPELRRSTAPTVRPASSVPRTPSLARMSCRGSQYR